MALPLNSTPRAAEITHLKVVRELYEHPATVTRSQKETLNQHRGKVIWMTGLSGSGKSTLANALEQELHLRGYRTHTLDGDNVRLGLCKDLGFSDADRAENIRRVAEVSRLMLDAGLIVITAFISPFKRERDLARTIVGPDDFLEVHVSTPLDICEKRDPKGLYRKARAGVVRHMTGISSPYEAPESPELRVDCNGPEACSLALAHILKEIEA